MVLDKLGSSLKESIKKILRTSHLNDALINEVLKDIQKSLLIADVDVKLVFELTKKIKEEINKKKDKFSQKEVIINTIYEELVRILGEGYNIKIKNKPEIFLLVGLFGSGKTTTCAKLSKYYQKRGLKVCILGLDTFRPAAMKQLEQLAKKSNIPVFIDENEKNPVKIIKKFKTQIKKYDLIITDTAGRDALNKELIKEIKNIEKNLKPSHTFLVLPADVGQNAKVQTLAFKEAININDVIITKLDGTAKAGGALTACALTNTNIQFIGVGEKIEDLEEFEPKKFVSRLLGMGDLETLLKKAEEIIDESQAKEVGERLMSGKFNLLDLSFQLESLNNMGSIQKVVNLIPGLSMANLPKELMGVQENKLRVFKIIMDSMTKEELMNPNIIKYERIERIAKGAGVSEKDVRELLKQYKQMKKILKKLSGTQPKNLKQFMKQFKGFKLN